MIEIRMRLKAKYPRMIDWYPTWWMNDNLRPVPVFTELTVCKKCDHSSFERGFDKLFCKGCGAEYE